jgi:DNA-directed RNA polymerase specialized sigma24 family protein
MKKITILQPVKLYKLVDIMSSGNDSSHRDDINIIKDWESSRVYSYIDRDVEILLLSLSIDQNKIIVLKACGFSSKEAMKLLNMSSKTYYTNYRKLRNEFKKKNLLDC